MPCCCSCVCVCARNNELNWLMVQTRLCSGHTAWFRSSQPWIICDWTGDDNVVWKHLSHHQHMLCSSVNKNATMRWCVADVVWLKQNGCESEGALLPCMVPQPILAWANQSSWKQTQQQLETTHVHDMMQCAWWAAHFASAHRPCSLSTWLKISDSCKAQSENWMHIETSSSMEVLLLSWKKCTMWLENHRLDHGWERCACVSQWWIGVAICSAQTGWHHASKAQRAYLKNLSAHATHHLSAHSHCCPPIITCKTHQLCPCTGALFVATPSTLKQKAQATSSTPSLSLLLHPVPSFSPIHPILLMTKCWVCCRTLSVFCRTPCIFCFLLIPLLPMQIQGSSAPSHAPPPTLALSSPFSVFLDAPANSMTPPALHTLPLEPLLRPMLASLWANSPTIKTNVWSYGKIIVILSFFYFRSVLH